MVSNSLGIPLEELVEKLESFRRTYADDPEYKELRADLPDDFPV